MDNVLQRPSLWQAFGGIIGAIEGIYEDKKKTNVYDYQQHSKKYYD